MKSFFRAASKFSDVCFKVEITTPVVMVLTGDKWPGNCVKISWKYPAVTWPFFFFFKEQRFLSQKHTIYKGRYHLPKNLKKFEFKKTGNKIVLTNY